MYTKSLLLNLQELHCQFVYIDAKEHLQIPNHQEMSEYAHTLLFEKGASHQDDISQSVFEQVNMLK